ncbi:MAG: DNA polymerase III subunit delta, partial [Betaproteobacteria bacterium]
MQLKLSQLSSHLQRPLLPVYLLHGDEPLLQIEAAQSIRDAAAKAGFAERELLVADSGFNWQSLAAANQTMSLFGSRRILDLRIPTGKPGRDGAEILERVGNAPSPDNLLLVSCPRLERSAQSSGWFTALESAGVAIPTPPLERDQLPDWMGQRLARNGQRATNEVLQFLADLTEGNLLAAQQEIDKLALLLPAGELTQAAIESAVANVARYDNAELSDALLGADVLRTCRILAGLQAEGEGVQLVLWQLGEDTHALLAVAQAARSGGAGAANAMRNARVWGRRQAPMERA